MKLCPKNAEKCMTFMRVTEFRRILTDKEGIHRFLSSFFFFLASLCEMDNRGSTFS